ncbi:MAG: pentapeptide repeat-containing protein [Pyrinomonadaceae bacterium]
MATKKKTAGQPEAKTLCHIHDDVGGFEVDDIREKVCVNDEPLSEFEGKQYCLFHLPTVDKDVEKFEEIFKARLEAVESKSAEIDKLPEGEQADAKEGFSYYFRYVWFPSKVELNKYNFSAEADFKSATFSAEADFISATFSGYANFTSATFSDGVYFSYATFSDYAVFALATFSAFADFRSVACSAYADFGLATFSADASFRWATFSADTSFRSATFSDDTYFRSATFLGEADFAGAKFSKMRETSFVKANFAKDTFFDRTRFSNDVTFNSAIFGPDSDVFFRRAFFAGTANFRYCTSEGYMRFSNLRQGDKNKFNFEEAAFEKANRVSFHTVDLCPNWFVNVDARKFVFADITWKNLDSDLRNRNIDAELDSLADTGAALQKKRIFEVAARQLAVNAEENNRYDEAAKFRYMAMETRRLEETKHFRASRFLIWVYKWTSGYGESWSRALVVLLCVLVLFGVLYAAPFAQFDYGEKGRAPGDGIVSRFCESYAWIPGNSSSGMNLCDGAVHSLSIASFQRPDPKPADFLTRLLVALETIFAPLQAALLALAIRRKFMR